MLDEIIFQSKPVEFLRNERMTIRRKLFRLIHEGRIEVCSGWGAPVRLGNWRPTTLAEIASATAIDPSRQCVTAFPFNRLFFKPDCCNQWSPCRAPAIVTMAVNRECRITRQFNYHAFTTAMTPVLIHVFAFRPDVLRDGFLRLAASRTFLRSLSSSKIT